MSENRLSPKERMKIPRQAMVEQPPDARRANFAEVNRGLTVLGATTEAMRCLECAKPHCQSGCPVNVNIREFVRLIGEGDYLSAAAKIREHPEECLREVRESCRLEAAHPEVRQTEERLS